MTMPKIVDELYMLADALAKEYEDNPTVPVDDFTRDATERVAKLARDLRPMRLVPNVSPEVQAGFEQLFNAGLRFEAGKFLREQTGCSVREAIDHLTLWPLRDEPALKGDI